MTEMRSYDSEDKIIKDLLETNIRQRGDIGGSDLKLGRRIKELERIYGVKQGRPSKNSSNGTTKMTDQDIADMNGIDINTLKRAKSLTTLPTEIQDLIEQGNISPSTANVINLRFLVLRKMRRFMLSAARVRTVRTNWNNRMLYFGINKFQYLLLFMS